MRQQSRLGMQTTSLSSSLFAYRPLRVSPRAIGSDAALPAKLLEQVARVLLPPLATVSRLTRSLRAVSAIGAPSAPIEHMSLLVSRGTALAIKLLSFRYARCPEAGDHSGPFLVNINIRNQPEGVPRDREGDSLRGVTGRRGPRRRLSTESGDGSMPGNWA